MGPEAQRLLQALRDFASAAREASLEGLVELKLSETDLKAMRYLLSEPGAMPRDIAQHLQVSSATTTVLVDRLERRGLVRREASAVDRRTVNVYPTVDADEEPWASLDRFDRRAGEIAAAFPPETVEAATRLITAMHEGAHPSEETRPLSAV